MNKLYLSSCLFFAVLLAACNQNTPQKHSDNPLPFGGGVAMKASLTETMVVNDEQQCVGLWSGSFDSTEVQKAIRKMALDMIDQEGGDMVEYGFIPEVLYKRLTAEQRRWIEVDVLYGEKYLAQPNKLSLVITEMANGQVKGRSVCSGNERPVVGTYKSTASGWTMTLREPGDDKYDGEFTLTANKADTLMRGTWKSFHGTTPDKTLTLTRQNYTYNPDYEWNFASWHTESEYSEDFNASRKLLSEKDVENQPKATLRVARNAIYARHGYSFKNRDIRNYFERYAEYVPITSDIRNKLTEIEQKNEALLKRYEQYAEQYYDAFGR